MTRAGDGGARGGSDEDGPDASRGAGGGGGTALLLAVSSRIYGLLVACYPYEQRQRYGEEMRRVFGDVCRSAAERGGVRTLVTTAAAEIWAAAASILGGRAAMWRRRLVSVWDDARWAVRGLLRRPGHTLTVALVLALGIGAFTTVFAVVHAAVLGPGRAGHGGRFVELWSHPEDPSRAVPGIERDVLEAARDMRSVFRVLEGYATARGVLTDGDAPAPISIVRVTPDFLRILGVGVARGVDLAAAGASGRPALMTHSLWSSRYGSDPGILGRSISLNELPLTVVGVLQRGIEFPASGPAVWILLDDTVSATNATSPLMGVGWLQPGLSFEEADSALALRTEVFRSEAGLRDDRFLTVVGADFLGTPRPTRNALLVLLGAVVFTLAVAAVNTVVLVLTHTLGRAPELAVRTALGSGIGRVRRQLVLESTAVGLLGGLAGAGLTAVALARIVPVLPDQLNLTVMDRSLEFQAADLLVAVSLGLVLGLVVGSSNALAGRRGIWFGLLRSGPGASESRRAGATRGVLVALQIAFSFVLLTGSALLAHTVMRLQAVDPGVDADRLLVAQLRLPPDLRRSADEADVVFRRVAEALDGLPAATGVSMTGSPLPLASGHFRPTLTSGEGVEVEIEDVLPYHRVAPGYLGLTGVSLLEGRDLLEGDPLESVVVSEVLARTLWPGAPAVGRRFRVRDESWRTVVGVAEDVPQMGLRDQPTFKGEYYVQLSAERAMPSRTFVIRTPGEPAALVGPARLALRELYPNLPFEEITPYRDLLGATVARERFFMFLMTLFAALAVTLSVVGLYGLLSQHVRSRTREIGIRMTLGADRWSLLGGIVRRGMLLVAVGVGAGLAGAWALSRFLEGLLFEVDAVDPLALTGAAAVFGVVALAACLLPGRRAVLVDPLVAVKAD